MVLLLSNKGTELSRLMISNNDHHTNLKTSTSTNNGKEEHNNANIDFPQIINKPVTNKSVILPQNNYNGLIIPNSTLKNLHRNSNIFILYYSFVTYLI